MNRFSGVRSLISASRPHQWLKNIFVVFPVIFINHGSTTGAFEKIIGLVALFTAFSIAASSAYIINDIADIQKDRAHPKKRLRAIASGKVTPKTAALFAVFLMVISLSIGLLDGSNILVVALLAYILLTLLYTFFFKDIPIMDVVVVGILYGIRVIGGFIVVSIYPASWVWWIASATFLACAVELGKRKSETQTINPQEKTRKTLTFYKGSVLPMLYVGVVIASCIAYMVAVVLISLFLSITVLLVFIGLVRYWNKLSRLTEDTHPQTVILKDPALLGILGVFMIIVSISVLRN